MNNNIRRQNGFTSDMETLKNDVAIEKIKAFQKITRDDFKKAYSNKEINSYQIKTCKAELIIKQDRNGNWYKFLRSYNTIVAAQKNNETPVLFGTYSATTWEHVNKAFNSYVRMDYVTGWMF